jgi:predicted aconitase
MAGQISRENQDERGSSTQRRPDWKTSLLAVLAGNAAYYSLHPHLPRSLQHSTHVDLGLGLDFLFCVICYFIARAIFD